jgi:hypothetical protein
VVGLMLNNFFYDLDVLQNNSVESSSQAVAECESGTTDGLSQVQSQRTPSSDGNLGASASESVNCRQAVVAEVAQANL